MISSNTFLRTSRQSPSSASTQKSIATPMHSLLGTNGLLSCWAGALCDTLLRYPLSGIPSSAFSISFWIDFHSSLTIYALRHQYWLPHPAPPASTSFAHTFPISTCIMRSPFTDAPHYRLFITTTLFLIQYNLSIVISPAYISFLSLRLAVLSTSWPGLIRLSTFIFPSLGPCRLHWIRSRLANALGWRYGYEYCIQQLLFSWFSSRLCFIDWALSMERSVAWTEHGWRLVFEWATVIYR
jgi:hypothetical protein